MGLWPNLSKPAAAAQPAAPQPAEILRQSQLVDSDWYRTAYPEAARAGLDPVEHYYDAGAAAGLNPNPFFDSAWYLEANPDVRAAGVNPLLHFVLSGASEGRAAGPDFDTAYYMAENPEVAAASINPLLHFLLYGKPEGRIAKPRDEAEAFEVGIRAKRQGMTGSAAALFKGVRSDHVHFALPKREAVAAGQSMPLPPLELAQRIGSVTLRDFENSGRGIRDAILRALPETFSWEGARCLDFGSGVGRALRHFGDKAASAEIWGCDIDGSSIRWSVRNLSPPFRFFQISEVPTIPFEDHSFDLVYAISVLSHIHTDWQQWLMEIRRILKPGGTFFVSFMGQTPFEEMLNLPYWEQGDDFGMYVKNPHNNWNAGGPMIFLSPAWIKSFWGSLFDIDYIAMDGLMEYQSFCLMRKPALGAPIRTEIPVLQLSTTQAFNPRAVGRITPQFDGALPYRESYGIDLKRQDRALVTGWIVFRGDQPEGMEVLVDEQTVDAKAVFELGASYRDWEGSPHCAFAVEIDLSAIAPGLHGLELRIRSQQGLTHSLAIPLRLREG